MKNATNGMGSWKKLKIAKQNRGSSATGRSKGMVPPTINRTICKRSRSYKLREFEAVMSKYTGEKIRWGSKS